MMTPPFRRRTLANIVAIEGTGLHSGLYTRLELRPAEAGTGVQFIRTDLHDFRIPAVQASTTALDYATSVGKDDISIGTVEHLLAAIAGCGVTDVELLIDGPEVPIIDGSALPFVNLIDAAGTRCLAAPPMEPLRVTRPLEVVSGEKWIRIEPADRLEIDYTIEFDHPRIGRQTFRFAFDGAGFFSDLAPARTFGFLREVEQLRAIGLARGGSVENCIVLDDEDIVSGPLRFDDEFVRHKIVDLLGDLVLIGRPVVGKISVFKGGHALHSRFVQDLVKLETTPEVALVSPADSAQNWY